jgi:hypothetical protein
MTWENYFDSNRAFTVICKSMRPYGYRMIWLFRLPPRMTISHSTMNYRKVMTKLNENNVTYVIQTMSSMNYFDSSRTNLTYILNGSQ